MPHSHFAQFATSIHPRLIAMGMWGYCIARKGWSALSPRERARLRWVKLRYDSGNVAHHNRNTEPAAQWQAAAGVDLGAGDWRQVRFMWI